MNADFFLNATLISLGFLLYWFLMLVLAPDFMYRFQTKAIKIPQEDFMRIHFLLLGVFKITATLLFVVPYIALNLS